MPEDVTTAAEFAELEQRVAALEGSEPEPRPAPTIDSFTVEPSEVEAGESVTLSWETTEADSVTLELVGSTVVDLGSQPFDGSLTHAPSESGTYVLTATNPEGEVVAEVGVTVTEPAPDPDPGPDPDVDLVLQDTLVNGHTVPAGETHEIKGTVESDANVVVLGTLRMRPSSTLRFVDVDESAMVGGGMDVLDTDVGLWVMGDGVLDVQGTPLTGWTRLAPGDTPPADWQPGDELLVCPNAPGQTAPDDFTLTDLAGLDAALPDPVALPDGTTLPTECANLSRDVVIEGTEGGRAHILIRSTQPQTVKHVLLRYLAPDIGADDSGRYGLHFHHCGDGSRGSIVEGVVARNCEGHAFVPHESHGITMRDCVAFDVFEHAYWWDPGDQTDDIVWDHCLAALVQVDPSFRGFRLTGFLLGQGEGLSCLDCSAVGVQGNEDASGFQWPEHANKPPNVWRFENNVAHNCRRHGLFTWQNNQNLHPVGPFTVYNCAARGVQHGAYKNSYRYHDFVVSGVERGINWKAQAHPNGVPDEDGYLQSWRRGYIDDADSGIRIGHTIASDTIPGLFKDIEFGPGVAVKLRATTKTGESTFADFVNCGIEPEDTDINTVPGSVYRFQREDGTAYQLDHQGNVTEIEPFYPDPGGA